MRGVRYFQLFPVPSKTSVRTRSTMRNGPELSPFLDAVTHSGCSDTFRVPADKQNELFWKSVNRYEISKPDCLRNQNYQLIFSQATYITGLCPKGSMSEP